MGTGDFVIETGFTNDNKSAYGLLVGLSDTTRLFLYSNSQSNSSVSADHTHNIDDAFPDFMPGFLRIEKAGTIYTFYYKENAGDNWTYFTSYTTAAPVSYVGLYGRSYDAQSAVTYNVDYFNLKRKAAAEVAVTVTVSNADDNPLEGLTVSAFNDATDTGIHGVTNENGQVTLALPNGNYRFRAELNGAQFWSGASNHCDVSVCNQVKIAIPRAITVGVFKNHEGVAGVTVRAFNQAGSGPVYTGYQQVTNENGEAIFTLPQGENYLFSADYTAPGAGSSYQFWNNPQVCSVPGCDYAEILLPAKPVIVTASNANGDLLKNLKIYAFQNEEYTGHSLLTDENGQAAFTLPEWRDYYFRTEFSDSGSNVQSPEVCGFPNCDQVQITVAMKTVTVTVLDTDSTPKEGLNVYAFDDDQFSGYYLTTDVNGQVTFTLPISAYHFRTDLNGTPFWSGANNHCAAGCESAAITVAKPVTVSLVGKLDTAYPGLPIYAYIGDAYTGYSAVTDANSQVTLTLPQGNYRFRADLDGKQFWSSIKNGCQIPGCENAKISLPSGGSVVTIDYTYDPLYRLIEADYSNGDAYAYSYDSVGNRLRQETIVNGLSSAVNYNYDIANRLTAVGGVSYAYDDNGNLLSDGANEYTYDPANRLTSVSSGQSVVSSYQYNGLGDRLSQNGVNYTLDLNAGLTQVLDDGTTTYTYGVGRISQEQGTTPEYFLGDALGSVRQLTNSAGAVTYAASYSPYGEVAQSSGVGQSAYGFTGEQQSGDMVYLRARYLNFNDGRFLSRDTWEGDYNSPKSLNRWNYTQSNPINYSDPSGNESIYMGDSGYSEGYVDSFVLAFMQLGIDGYEIVYDFQTLERARFHVTKRIDPPTIVSGLCTSVFNLTDVSYASVIYGFEPDDGLVDDYSGIVKSVSGGWSLVGFGAGSIGFVSADRDTNSIDWDIWGLSAYKEVGADLSLALTFEAGGMTTEYKLASVVKKYPSIDAMTKDILSGEGSPVMVGVSEHRKWAAEQAEYFKEFRK
jgi:RHS repeat-associated protein